MGCNLKLDSILPLRGGLRIADYTESMDRRPLVIWDGQCGFCRIWIEYWKQLTGDRVEYATSQDAGAQFPQIPPEDFGRSVQFVLAGGTVLRGAKAVFELLKYAPGYGWLPRLYDALPGFAPISEAAYRFIASHRNLFYRLTRLLFGNRIVPLSHGFTEWLFIRLLGAIYLGAFVSLGVQVAGLVGERGILPAGRYLDAFRSALGVAAYWNVPTLFWIAHGDIALKVAAGAGAAVAIVLMLGFAQRWCLAVLFVLYLSLFSVGQDFLSFQWDLLLLETGFLAIFLGSSRIVLWLFRWLLFRLTFLSGAAKLLSRDPNWIQLRALDFHYWTQPLPTPLAWYMSQLPPWFGRVSTGMVFFIELFIPFLIFTPRRSRFFAAGWLLFLQILIFLTGNYTFFNLLTMLLCLLLFDDQALLRNPFAGRPMMCARRAVVIPLVVMIAALSIFQVIGTLSGGVPAPGRTLIGFAAPFGIVNSYGLFAAMTTTRREIVVQGSQDGVKWLDYEFPYKPGDPKRAPRWVAPHQPRLDWQMWFAALGDYRSNPWFVNFMERLLEGAPEVTALLSSNPFPHAPPRYVRAVVYNYKFSDFATRRATGQWWTREPAGLYLPEVSLQDFKR
jgi:predicted DCC family thiol-disulfide oxidoreductase YuxK